MSSIITAVVKATVGLLVAKARDKAAERLKDGDVTEQKFRGLIVREIDHVKSKLDGLSRKDLLASISFFEEGIGCLYDVFDKVRSRSEHGTATTQAAGEEVSSLTEGMKKLELIDLDQSATGALCDAKKRFEDSRREATKAFSNEALETSDRILAMQYRVMATILEKVDNPEAAIAPCRVCVEELNSLSAVQSCFNVQLKKGLRVLGLFGKDERREIISGVCQVNRVVYDVTQTVSRGVYRFIWPTVDVGEDKVDPLRDRRLRRVLRKRGMEQCCVTLSFGQEGEEEHKLKEPVCIATNSGGQFIIGDREDCTVKVFDSGGRFVKHFSVRSDVVDTKLYIHGVATDVNDNIYVLVELKKPGTGLSERAFVYKFESNSNLRHQFPVRGGGWEWHRVIVSDSGKVLVLRSENVIDVYESDGEFVRSFGEGTLNSAFNITAANDGRVMIVDKSDSFVRIFSEDGDHLDNFKRQEGYRFPEIAFHQASEHVIVASAEPEKEHLHVEIYTRDGEFVHSTKIHEERIEYLRGIAATLEGRIALVVKEKDNYKVLVE